MCSFWVFFFSHNENQESAVWSLLDSMREGLLISFPEWTYFLCPSSVVSIVLWSATDEWNINEYQYDKYFQSLRCNTLLSWQASGKERGWRTGLQSDKSRLGEFNIRSTEILWNKIYMNCTLSFFQRYRNIVGICNIVIVRTISKTNGT